MNSICQGGRQRFSKEDTHRETHTIAMSRAMEMEIILHMMQAVRFIAGQNLEGNPHVNTIWTESSLLGSIIATSGWSSPFSSGLSCIDSLLGSKSLRDFHHFPLGARIAWFGRAYCERPCECWNVTWAMRSIRRGA